MINIVVMVRTIERDNTFKVLSRHKTLMPVRSIQDAKQLADAISARAYYDARTDGGNGHVERICSICITIRTFGQSLLIPWEDWDAFKEDLRIADEMIQDKTK